MTQEHPITPPPELVMQWLEKGPEDDEFGISQHIATQAARWGADEQLEQDARWLDTCALFSTHLTITPSGDALRQAMRSKPPSLKEQALFAIDTAVADGRLSSDVSNVVRRALEALPND